MAKKRSFRFSSDFPHLPDKDANSVVHRVHSPVVVHDECPLHPTLPFLRLVSIQDLNTGSRVVLESECCSAPQDNVHKPKHAWVVVFIAGIALGPVVADVGHKKNYANLALGLCKVHLTLPVVLDDS